MEHLTVSDRAFQPYLDRVAHGLKVLPAAERTDLLRELASHLEDGRAAGEAPEALMARMGNPEEVAGALVRERLAVVDQRRSPLELTGLVLQAAFAPLLVVLVGLLLAEAVYLPMSSSAQPVAFFVSSMAVMAMFVLPFGLLMLGAFGIPKLHRELSPALFSKVLPGFCAAALALAVAATVSGYTLSDGWWTGQGRLGDGALAGMQQEVNELAAEYRTLAASQSLQPTKAKRLQLERVEKRLDMARINYSMAVTLPVFPLGVTAMGLVLGYLCRRASFMLTTIAAGLGVAGQIGAAGVMVVGALAAKEFGAFSWPGVLLQWFLVMTVLVVVLLLDRKAAHVQ